MVGVCVGVAAGFDRIGQQARVVSARRRVGPFAIVLILFALALAVPTISLAVRRLHDANLSGWLYLLSFIPLINYFTWAVFGMLSTNPAGARYDAR